MSRYIRIPAILACVAASLVAQDGSQEEAVRLNPAPGRYERTVLLSLERSRVDTELRYRVLGVGSSDFVGYEGPIELSAVPGELRTYRVLAREVADESVVSEREGVYRIDRRRPPAPAVSLPAGFYPEPQEVRFSVPAGAAVFYAIEGPEFRRYGGGGIELSGTAGARTEYRIEAFARYDEGPRSPMVTRRIVIDRDVREPETIPIESPAAGRWANPQLLVIDSSGFEDIRYSTDGSDPETGGRRYEGPVLLDTDGETVLRVRGVTASGRVLTQRREFSAGTASLLEVEQGVRTEAFSIDPPEAGVYRYSRGGARSSSPFSRPVSLSVQRGSRRGSELIVEGPLDREGEARSFRYFFVLDGRVPAPPEVIVDVAGRRALVSMTGSRGATVDYAITVSGQLVQDGLYDGPVAIELPGGVEDGRIEVRAASAYGAERRSEQAVVTRRFDTSPPAPPQPAALPTEAVRQAELTVDAAGGTQVLYELAFGSTAAEPDAASPRLAGGTAVLGLPRGVSGTASLRLRAIDAAGNLSTVSGPYSVELDARPPRAPQVVIERDVVRISGDGSLIYRVRPEVDPPRTSEQDHRSEVARAARAYSAPFRLAGEAGERVDYEVSAYAVDELGNRSSLVTRRHVVDRRIPRVPDGLTVTDGAAYAEASVRVQAIGADSDLLLHYTATTDGSEPAEPTTEAPALGATGITFEAEEGEEVPVRIKLLPRFSGTAVTGRVRSLSFALDRRPPALPTVDGVAPGAAYSDARELTLGVGDPEGDTVTVEVRRTVGAGEPVASRLVYEEPVRLHGAPGTETLYELRFRVRDRAGNETTSTEPVRVLIDRRPPTVASPRITGTEGTSVFGMMSDGPILVSPPEEAGLRYETSANGETPAPVTEDSPELSAPIELSGEQGREVLYRLAYRSVDEAGNLSPETESTVVVVDRRAPPPPEAPSVRVSEDGRSARLSWTTQPGYRTGYRIIDGEEDELRRAENGTRVGFPAGETRLLVEAVQVDEVGNRSEPRRFEIRGFTVSPRPALSGIEDGAVYGETVVVRNRTTGATVRYELAVGDESPESPTRFSEAMPDTLPFDVAPGETVRYTLRARAFSEDTRPSPEVALSFTVDRTAPPPPELVEARSGDFYTSTRSVELTAPEGRIRYRLSLVGGEAGSFRDYEDSVTLDAVPGRLAHYRLEAFTVDAAGNRSGAPRVWDLYIDQEIVYVASEAGEDGNGSRAAPFARLADAVAFARSQDRRTIFVAGGRYEVTEPLTVRDDLSVQGGLSADTWRREDELVTEIVAPDLDGTALFSVSDASLTLERIDLTVEGGPAVRGRGARVFMQGLGIEAAGAPGVLSMERSRAEGRRLEVQARDVLGGSVFAFRGGEASFNDLSVDAEAPGRRLSVVEITEGGRIELTGASLTAGAARQSSLIRADEATVSVADSELSAGPAGESSDTVRASGSDVTIRGSVLSGGSEAAILTLVGVRGGSLTLEGSTLEIAADRGATGVFARGARIAVTRNAFRAGATGEFLHLVSLRDVTGLLDTNLFFGGESSELIIGRIVDSDTRWYNNTIRGGGGTRFTQAFNLTGRSRTQLANNVVFHAADGTGTAIYTSDGSGRLEARANAFSGWDVVLRTAAEGRRWTPPGGDEERGARTAADLNAQDLIEAESNIDVPGRDVFADDVHLRADAPLIDAGVHIRDADGPAVDWDGQERPQPGEGASDIGADEFFR